MVTRVVTYGTFDILHIGHINLLKRASEFGQELHVGVSTDKFNALKGKKCLLPYDQRSEIVSSLKFVTSVFPEETWEQKVADVKKLSASTFVIGSDWAGKFDFLKDHCDVQYLTRTDGVSSTDLKATLKKVSDISIKDLTRAIEILEEIHQELS